MINRWTLVEFLAKGSCARSAHRRADAYARTAAKAEARSQRAAAARRRSDAATQAEQWAGGRWQKARVARELAESGVRAVGTATVVDSAVPSNLIKPVADMQVARAIHAELEAERRARQQAKALSRDAVMARWLAASADRAATRSAATAARAATAVDRAADRAVAAARAARAAGDDPGADVEPLARRWDEDGLARLVDAGDAHAAQRLAELLFDQENQEGLAHHAAVGNPHAAKLLVTLLLRRRDEGGLARLAEAGDVRAAARLADLLADRLNDKALACRAEAGDSYAAARLTEVRIVLGDDLGQAEGSGPLASTTLEDVLGYRWDDDERPRSDDAEPVGPGIDVQLVIASLEEAERRKRPPP